MAAIPTHNILFAPFACSTLPDYHVWDYERERERERERESILIYQDTCKLSWYHLTYIMTNSYSCYKTSKKPNNKIYF